MGTDFFARMSQGDLRTVLARGPPTPRPIIITGSVSPDGDQAELQLHGINQHPESLNDHRSPRSSAADEPTTIIIVGIRLSLARARREMPQTLR